MREGRRRHRVGLWGGGETAGQRASALSEAGEDDAGGTPPELGEAVVYTSRWTLDREGAVIHREETGTLTREIAARSARPWLYRAEPLVYGNDASSRELADGMTEHEFRVFSRPNLEPWTPPQTAGVPELGELLRQRLELVSPDDLVKIIVEMRNYPQWDIPLRSTTAPSSPEDDAAAVERRGNAILARKALYAEMAAPIEEHIRELGGVVRGNGWGGGWLVSLLPARSVMWLAQRTDLRIVNLSEGTASPGWHLGEGRTVERTGADSFIDAGFNGGQPQPTGGRHSYGTVAIGVIELEALEDEACFFDDGSGCDSNEQLIGRYMCGDSDNDGNFCELVTNYTDPETDFSRHGTQVVASAIANYRQGQAGAHVSSIAGSSPNPDWENEATGFAPEARVVYFGNIDLTENESFADAYDDAIDLGLDITNASWSWDSGTSGCNPVVEMDFEYEAENAFDDGILNVGITHNGGYYTDPCEIGSPGDLHTVFTVAGHQTQSYEHTDCGTDLRDCDLGPHRVGGADLTLPGGTIVQEAGSLVDLVAPGNGVNSLTSHVGTWGQLSANSGSSYAGPMVAGMAALVKDMYLNQNHTWINDPGRLHTAMLAMGDRHRSDTNTDTWQAYSGTSKLWGLGRAKLRMFASGGGLGAWRVRTGARALTTSTPDERVTLWSDTLPSGTKLVKCVLFQREDMSGGKTEVSDVDIRLRTRFPNAQGQCVANGAFHLERPAYGADVKSMVAIETSNLAGKCAELDIFATNVSTTYGVTAWYYCYAAGLSDDEPN